MSTKRHLYRRVVQSIWGLGILMLAMTVSTTFAALVVVTPVQTWAMEDEGGSSRSSGTIDGAVGEDGGERAGFEATKELPRDEINTVGVCDDGGVPGLDSNKAFECDCDAADGNLDATNCDIIRVLEIGTNVLATIAGLAVAGGFMFGSYLWMTARDNPGQIQAARQKIVWALVALLILLFFWGFLQWLIPGGLL